MQLARLTEGFLEDAPVEIVQAVRIDVVVERQTLALLNLVRAHAQQLDEGIGIAPGISLPGVEHAGSGGGTEAVRARGEGTLALLLQLLLNGAARGAPISSTSFSLDNLDRGEYQAQVKILDKNGKEMGTSDSVTFQVKRHSKLMPNAGGQSGTKPVNTPVKKNP